MKARRLAWIVGVLALVAALGIAYGAYTLAGYSWDQVVSYDAPFADPDLPWDEDVVAPVEASEVTSTSPRLVLVVVDGLRLTESNTRMATLETLRGYGADMVAVTPQPSLSYPTWTTILSGAPPEISGVTTNWFEGRVPVETLLDVALAEGMRTVVVGPDDFVELYGADRAAGTHFAPWSEDKYMASGFVDEAIDLIETEDPQLVIVHLPDADETAHHFGPDSDEYAEVVSRIDGDISRLVAAAQDDRTSFIVTADHGHIDGGGHGGWEGDVTRVPAVFVGDRISLVGGDIDQVDIAPTAAGILGIPVPRFGMGKVRGGLFTESASAVDAGHAQYRAMGERYLEIIEGSAARMGGARTYEAMDVALIEAREARLIADRNSRLWIALMVAAGALAILLLIAALSWRALVAALGGALAYYIVYNALYFMIHGYQWSLSAFNTEDLVEAFFNLRMLEAAIAGLVAVVVAAIIYPLLRSAPKGARGSYLGGWLALGPATVLAVQATLGFQVAWFLWAWGADVVWRLPDLKWGFKYDLDLIQITALGVVALLAPLVTFLIGRYHPRVQSAEDEESPAPVTPEYTPPAM